ncbi:PAS domain-containing sensor histidine kinase [Fulvivirga lutea]|uniref:histidine kinase n=1 Tax=Fulvivirga lutea TaxID=2810512 RepID=A0A974WGQ6_9BACT|nr:PAS domain-containing sensor histidine kinase [Fulvivirga lutea]QSE98203.1 PAS domain-containing sensor histidine kinase [Fulvivirga lutea]
MNPEKGNNTSTDKKFRALMAKAHEGIVLYDVQGRITYATASSQNILGFEVEEVLGKSGVDFVHPDEVEISSRNLASVLSVPKSSITFRQRLLHKNKHYIWAETTLSNFLHDPDVGGVISNFRDITSQKLAEDELMESKTLLESINQNIKEAIYRNLPDRSFEYVNQAFLEMFRFESLDELNKVTSSSLYVDPDIRQFVKKELLEKKAINNIEAEFKRKDGTTFWGLISSTLITAPDGTEYFDGAIRDITSQKQAEEKLKRSEEFLTSINRNIKEGLYRSTLNKGMVYVNDAFAEIFGYSSAKAILETDVEDLYYHLESRKEIVKELREKGSIRNKEIQFRRKSGEVFWGLMSSYLNKSNAGEYYFDGAIRDITELKKTEHKLIVLNETLKSQNKKLEKRENELNKALQELSDRNFELDQLVYKTSHDLRSPLSSILGLVHVAKLDDSSESKTEYIDKIGASIHRLDDFVKSMLNYAKASRVEVKNEELNIRELIDSSINDLEYLENFDKVSVEVDIKGEEKVNSDKLKLKIILSNIISNAYKYMDLDKEANFLKVSVSHLKKTLKISIQDNGIGIDEEHLPKIFDMFYRGTEKSQGSGLGMYIVKQSIDKLEGKISIESTPGHGTTFTITIPIR